MYQANELATLNMDCEAAVDLIAGRLGRAGMQVVRSFDLRAARAVHDLCACPYHGLAGCDCQMVVLLVYSHEGSPATLVAHGKDGGTVVSLVENPQERASGALKEAIAATLTLDDVPL